MPTKNTNSMRSRLNLRLGISSILMALAGCGGGGSGSLVQNGSGYNLTPGQQDSNGGGYANLYGPSGSSNYATPQPLSFWGQPVTGATTTTGPTLTPPPANVIEAWRDGWTGLGRNVLIIDDLTADPHGPQVTGVLRQLAPAANFFGKEFNASLRNNALDTLPPLGLNGEPAVLVAPINIHVANLSFSYLSTEVSANNSVVSSLKDLVGFRYEGLRLSDAVISVAAGNGTNGNGISTTVGPVSQPLAHALLSDDATYSRTLVVGALSTNSSYTSGVIASYSNTPGADVSVQNRFVVASGQSNWLQGSYAVSGAQSRADVVGTSLAAPRVAAYATILRQKFPNLTGSSAASILLDTAGTDALTCHPNCSPTIYGRGEVNLRRALAPVGPLR